MSMTLGDAFNRRKKLSVDFQTWLNRMGAAGSTRRSYRTKAVEGEGALVPEPGTERTTSRHYTIEECRERLQEVLAEDRSLALRISLTNQRARAELEDLDGQVRQYSIPELLVLKSDIIPKLEQAARTVPLRADGVSVFEGEGEALPPGAMRHRTIVRVERKKETFSDKGLKAEEMVLLGFDVVETTDYGRPPREIYNEIDRIQELAQRVKHAINKANKTPLIEP